MHRERKLAISEIFYSIQGEGKTMGYPAVFLRLGGCNLMCGGMGTQTDKELHNEAEWRCDTIEVWTKSITKPISEILDSKYKMELKRGAHLIITGGEPLMQQTSLIPFIALIKEETNCFIEIETNGTIIPKKELLELVDLFNCSPKTKNSGNEEDIRLKPKALRAINEDSKDSIFKFVISNLYDYNEIITDFGNYISRDKVWLMPAGENQKLLNTNKELVANICKEHNLKYTTRLHIEIWNQKTGV
jgi:organic radical activating enzyme